jgi:16S rRNA (guanine966-N2)-methyltransferase
LVTSAFVWAKRDMTSAAAAPPAGVPWLVFCSPPYAFYVDRLDDMLDLIRRIQQHAPPGSILVLEADERLDFNRLMSDNLSAWTLRVYSPAVIGIWRRE